MMQLVGNANWWFPRWLDRLVPHIGIHPPAPRVERERSSYVEVMMGKERADSDSPDHRIWHELDAAAKEYVEAKEAFDAARVRFEVAKRRLEVTRPSPPM